MEKPCRSSWGRQGVPGDWKGDQRTPAEVQRGKSMRRYKGVTMIQTLESSGPRFNPSFGVTLDSDGLRSDSILLQVSAVCNNQ